MLEIKSLGCILSLSWILAHGRIVPGWLPPTGLSEIEARSLNDKVDSAARGRVLERLELSARQNWHRVLASAIAWEKRVVHMVAAVACRYRSWLDQQP